MAGPFDIQRAPRGLLDALGMKGSGQTPLVLQPSVSPDFDATWLYLSDTRRYLAAVAPNVSQGNFVWNSGNQVPAGEMWIVTAITLLLNTSDITAAGRFRIGYTQPTSTSPSTNYNLVSDELVVTAGTIGTYSLGAVFPPGQLILGPGMAIGFHTQAGGYATTWGIPGFKTDYYRLSI